LDRSNSLILCAVQDNSTCDLIPYHADGIGGR
jgi:hypothetical protein